MAYPVVKQAGPKSDQRIEQSDQYKNDRFTNHKTLNLDANIGSTIKRMLFEKPSDASPKQPIPIRKLTPELIQEQDYALFRLGHSSILLKLADEIWLLDPVFSERASPYSFIGPKRFHQTPIGLEQLPAITGVIISHDHYDHLDKATIKSLKSKTEHFITPLGIGSQLEKWGVAAEKIHELDWWQSIQVADSKFVATPAQHFSGRGLRDRNKTLWASWVIQYQDLNIFFSGDSGYFDGFKQIGDKYGPFDITLMETGAYDENWPEVHMQPKQTVQAHRDLHGKRLIPIHNGTFDLALHNWYEPLERIQSAALQHSVELVTPIIGAPLSLTESEPTYAWWKPLMPQDLAFAN